MSSGSRPLLNVLVVAVWNEDTGWLEKVPQSWDLMVLRKGIDLPNVGREAATFLAAMAMPEVRAADYVACVQGSPLDHAPNLIARLAAPRETPFEWLGEPHLSDRMGGPWDRLPIVAGAAIRRLPEARLDWLRKEAALERNAWSFERLWQAILEGT